MTRIKKIVLTALVIFWVILAVLAVGSFTT